MNNHGNRHVMNRKHDGSKTPKPTKAEKKLARKIAQAGRIGARAGPDELDGLIERLELGIGHHDAAAALVQLRDSEALARGKIAEQMIEIERLRQR